MKITERNLTRLNWREFAEIVPDEVDTVIMGIGTVEAHGAIPLGTDIMIPEWIIGELSGRFDFIVAPTVNYGVTRSLIAYPGSHTVTSETFTAYITEVFSDFGRMGFRRLIVVNGHGGHLNEIKNAARAAWREEGLYALALHWWEMVGDIGEEVYGIPWSGHAAAEETAGVLVVDPALLKTELLDDTPDMGEAPGAMSFPVYRSIMVKNEGTGRPDPDVKKAQKYMDKVVGKLAGIIEKTLAGWDDLDRVKGK